MVRSGDTLGFSPVVLLSTFFVFAGGVDFSIEGESVLTRFRAGVVPVTVRRRGCIFVCTLEFGFEVFGFVMFSVIVL